MSGAEWRENKAGETSPANIQLNIQENRKLAIMSKVGYSAGVYGCSNEFFALTIITVSLMGTIANTNLNFKGLYGSDARVKELLKSKGFILIENYHQYGKMTSKEAKSFLYENQVIETLSQLSENPIPHAQDLQTLYK